MSIQRGVVWENSWKRAGDLGEPHGVSNPLAFQRLVIAHKSFPLSGEEGKRKKKKEINPVV